MAKAVWNILTKNIHKSLILRKLRRFIFVKIYEILQKKYAKKASFYLYLVLKCLLVLGLAIPLASKVSLFDKIFFRVPTQGRLSYIYFRM